MRSPSLRGPGQLCHHTFGALLNGPACHPWMRYHECLTDNSQSVFRQPVKEQPGRVGPIHRTGGLGQP